MTNMTMENGHNNSRFFHWTWWFSMVMFYQRVLWKTWHIYFHHFPFQKCWFSRFSRPPWAHVVYESTRLQLPSGNWTSLLNMAMYITIYRLYLYQNLTYLWHMLVFHSHVSLLEGISSPFYSGVTFQIQCPIPRSAARWCSSILGVVIPHGFWVLLGDTRGRS